MRVCPKCGKNYFQSERFCAVDGMATDEVPDSGDPRSMIGGVLGNYKISALLGEGGMGMVFKAEHQTIGREVALKVLHEELANKKDVVDRFFTEAKAVNRIKHENIIEITDFATTPEGKSYFVMELLEGRALAQALQEEGPFDFGRSIRVGVQIADALMAAHKLGIVHRDLKPENVFLITRSGYRDFVKLLDFGIAKLIGDKAGISKTRTGMIIGTPAYMSPEQAQGEAIDGRTDMYAWGIILYEMVCGRPPFGGDNVSKILLAHVGSPPPPPRQFRPELAPSIEGLILRCLSKDREQRYADMTEARAALVAAAEEIPAEQLGAQPPLGSPVLRAMSPTPVPGLGGVPSIGPVSTRAPVSAIGATDPGGGGAPTGTYPPTGAAAISGTIPPTSGTPYPRPDHGKSGGAGKFIIAALVVIVFGGLGTGGVLYVNGVEPIKSTVDGILGRPATVHKKKNTRNVLVDSKPSGATVTTISKIGSTPVTLGTTPFKDEMYRDEVYELTFKLDGYLDKTVKVDPDVLDKDKFVAALERDPSKKPTDPPETSRPTPDTAEPDTAAPKTSVVAPTPPDGMAYLPGGKFMRGRDGSTDPYEGPSFETDVPEFYLDLRETSNTEYAKYVAASGLKKLPKGWKGGKPSAEAENYPVVNVSWDEAGAYCEWRRARLPSEAEWEYAAKGGSEDRPYPWGARYDATMANGKSSGSGKPMAVDSLSAGASATGVLHLSGNVWEWTGSALEIYPGSDKAKAKVGAADARVIRGGSWDSPPEKMTSTFRLWVGKGSRDSLLGFRCAKDAP